MKPQLLSDVHMVTYARPMARTKSMRALTRTACAARIAAGRGEQRRAAPRGGRQAAARCRARGRAGGDALPSAGGERAR